ncbi:hypothetical protein NECID01_1214 [Nematocida sp. AWRm77]|nr:hypothetical protein NECID01_1214 [Nematocida sp. AWRm77]
MLRYYTVEYDGCTYKKAEEKTEKEKGTGSKYFFEVLHGTQEEKDKLKRIIGKINKRNKWKDLSDKQEKVYTKMEKILGKLRQYTPFSIPFLNKVSKREAPEYYSKIATPMDLGKIGKKIAAQEYMDVREFSADLELIWQNCFEFNNEHGNIYAMYAQKMKEKVAVLLQDLYSERETEVCGSAEEVAHILATEKQRKELAVARTAILQRPSEFVSRRSSAGMGEFWAKEQAASKISTQKMQSAESHLASLRSQSLEDIFKQNLSISSADEGKEKPHIPEYTHFYNSFPVEINTEAEMEADPAHPDAQVSLDFLIRALYEKYRGLKRGASNESFPPDSASEHVLQSKKTDIAYKEMNMCLTKTEASLIMKKVVATELVSVGFTSVDSSALNILVTHALLQIDKVLETVTHYQAKETSKHAFPEETGPVVGFLAKKYNVKSIDLAPVSFFSDEEENTEEEDTIDLMYSDVEEIEPLDSML